jgi:hypothetical protein
LLKAWGFGRPSDVFFQEKAIDVMMTVGPVEVILVGEGLKTAATHADRK